MFTIRNIHEIHDYWVTNWLGYNLSLQDCFWCYQRSVVNLIYKWTNWTTKVFLWTCIKCNHFTSTTTRKGRGFLWLMWLMMDPCGAPHHGCNISIKTVLHQRHVTPKKKFYFIVNLQLNPHWCEQRADRCLRLVWLSSIAMATRHWLYLQESLWS